MFRNINRFKRRLGKRTAQARVNEFREYRNAGPQSRVKGGK